MKKNKERVRKDWSLQPPALTLTQEAPTCDTLGRISHIIIIVSQTRTDYIFHLKQHTHTLTQTDDCTHCHLQYVSVFDDIQGNLRVNSAARLNQFIPIQVNALNTKWVSWSGRSVKAMTDTISARSGEKWLDVLILLMFLFGLYSTRLVPETAYLCNGSVTGAENLKAFFTNEQRPSYTHLHNQLQAKRQTLQFLFHTIKKSKTCFFSKILTVV